MNQPMLGALCLACVLSCSAPPVGDPDAVQPNDNRRPAGQLRGDTLHLHLELRMARWQPEAPGDSGVVVPAFAEPGKPPQIPAPLIRVRAGTVISARVRNTLSDSTAALYGLITRPAGFLAGRVSLRPGEERTLVFAAGAPGTYTYVAMTGERNHEAETAGGAFIVDPPQGSPPDRVFVINIWANLVDSVYPNAVTINGRSWPYTERIHAELGDSVRWRWVNASGRPHPMHLHGFYFTLLGLGDGFRDSLITPANQQLMVTQELTPGATMSLNWVPDRPGNWLFHCHLTFHVLAGMATLAPPDTAAHHEAAADPARHMAGLVLGMTVPHRRKWKEPARSNVRSLRLFIQEGRPRGRANRALGFVLERGSPPASDSVEIPGSLLVLNQGVPTDIAIHNRLREPAAIHWHGIELESYSDGVAGWSGIGKRMAPAVAPGDSFVARLTLPRPGTFIYHTHLNDIEQITSGLYGAIVVLPPGHAFDSTRDHLFIGGWDGPGAPPHLLINGDSLPGPPLELAAGVTHRFRFVNIGPAGNYRPVLVRDTIPVQWTEVAKDGADLAAAQVRTGPARSELSVGETRDVEWTPQPGRYALRFMWGGKPAVTQPIVVR